MTPYKLSPDVEWSMLGSANHATRRNIASCLPLVLSFQQRLSDAIEALTKYKFAEAENSFRSPRISWVLIDNLARPAQHIAEV